MFEAAAGIEQHRPRRPLEAVLGEQALETGEHRAALGAGVDTLGGGHAPHRAEDLPTAIWVQGHYAYVDGRYIWVPGHWEY